VNLDANKRVVASFDAVLNTGELDRLDELCTPDMVNHSLGASRSPGLAGTREYLGTGGRSWKSDSWRESAVVAEGDLVVQFGVRRGTWPGGPFGGFEMPAGEYTREMAVMYRLIDGRIAERWAVRDDLGTLIQLGALTPQSPAPAAGSEK
jgi:predicted SnoaL-like aldol condensation-catalyzing enzyme